MVAQNPDAEYDNVKSLLANTFALGQMRASMKGLAEEFQSNLNAVSKFTEVYKRSEQIQLQSLAVGTIYSKFVDRNTAALQDNLANTQEMTQFLVGGFARGLRDVNRSTVDLADDMLLTGQNTEALIGVMGGLTILTRDSNQAQSKLSKTINKNTKDYGVNATSMIQALNAVKSSLDQAAIYGDDAVTAYAETATSLKAAMAGAEGSDKAIATFLGMSKAMDIGVQSQLGLVDIMKELRDGNGNQTQAIANAAKTFEDGLMGMTDLQQEAIRSAFGEAQVNSLLMLSKGLNRGNKLTEEMKATEEAKAATLAAQKNKVDNYYNKIAPETYEVISRWLPQIAMTIAAAPALAGAGRLGMNAFKNSRTGLPGGPGTPPIPKLGMLGSLGKAVGAFAMFAGPIGLGITALSYGIPLITDYMKGTDDSAKKTAEETEKLRKLEEEKKRRNTRQAFDANTVSRAARLASGLLKSSGPGRSRVELLLQQQLEATQAVVRNTKPRANGDGT